MRQEMDLFLDECVGSDPNLLRDLLETLARERRQIEQQASRVTAQYVQHTLSVLARLSPSGGILHSDPHMLVMWRGGSEGGQ